MFCRVFVVNAEAIVVFPGALRASTSFHGAASGRRTTWGGSLTSPAAPEAVTAASARTPTTEPDPRRARATIVPSATLVEPSNGGTIFDETRLMGRWVAATGPRCPARRASGKLILGPASHTEIFSLRSVPRDWAVLDSNR